MEKSEFLDFISSDHATNTGPDNADQIFDRNREAGKSKIVGAVWSYQSRRYPRVQAG